MDIICEFYLKAEEDKYLQHVSEIPYLQEDVAFFLGVESETMGDLHFYVCYKFRRSITHLNFCDHRKLFIDGYFRRPFYFLSQFSHLTHLSLHSKCDQHLTIFQVLQAFPDLISFTFVSGFPVHDQATFTLDEILKDDGFSNQRLKVLDIKLPSLTAPYIKYISSCLPKSLDTLRSTITDANFYNCIEYNGIDAIVKLAERMSRLKNIVFITLPYGEDRRILDGGSGSKISNFFKVMTALKGTRDWHCEGELTGAAVAGGSIAISINEENKQLSFKYGIDDEDYINARANMAPYYLRGVGHCLCQILDLKLSTLRITTFQHVSSIPVQHFKCAMNFPHLTSFELTCVYGRLKLTATKPVMFEGNNNSIVKTSSTRNHLTNVVLEGALFTDDLLCVFSSSLPNIKSLMCLACGYHDDDSNGYNDLIMDLSGFKCLDYFYIDIRSMLTDSTDFAFVHIEYTDSEITDYYKITKSDKDKKKYYTFAPTTVDHMKECMEKAESSQYFSSMGFKCNRIGEFNFCDRETVVAELNYGVLRIPSSSINKCRRHLELVPNDPCAALFPFPK